MHLQRTILQQVDFNDVVAEEPLPDIRTIGLALKYEPSLYLTAPS
jgi:hypothetical protein